MRTWPFFPKMPPVDGLCLWKTFPWIPLACKLRQEFPKSWHFSAWQTNMPMVERLSWHRLQQGCPVGCTGLSFALGFRWIWPKSMSRCEHWQLKKCEGWSEMSSRVMGVGGGGSAGPCWPISRVLSVQMASGRWWTSSRGGSSSLSGTTLSSSTSASCRATSTSWSTSRGRWGALCGRGDHAPVRSCSASPWSRSLPPHTHVYLGWAFLVCRAWLASEFCLCFSALLLCVTRCLCSAAGPGLLPTLLPLNCYCFPREIQHKSCRVLNSHLLFLYKR